MDTKKRKRDGETAAERLGYRWMMRCLRAMDKAGLAGQRSIEVVVRNVTKPATADGFTKFMAELRPAAKHAVTMMRNASMPLEGTFETEGYRPEGSRTLHHRYKLVFTARW